MPGVAAAALYAERGPVDAASVFLATPVHYLAEMNNVRLPADGILSLRRPEAEALAVDFNRVWSDAGIRLLSGGGADLFCAFDQPTEAATADPEDVLDRHIADHLPAGAAAPRLRQLMSEIEMWLFEHPVNRARIAQAAPVLSGLWLWGGGPALASLPAVNGWTAGDRPIVQGIRRAPRAPARRSVPWRTPVRCRRRGGDGGGAGHGCVARLGDALAGAVAGGLARRPHRASRSIGRSALLQRERALALAPLAAPSALVGVVRMRAEIRRRPPAAPCDFTADVHPVLRRVYAARGLCSDADLDLSLDRLLPVGSLEGVDAAAQLLTAHRSAGRVLVIGDFDADGATSTALVVRALRAMHFAHVDFLVPNRFRFGYGLTPEIVALAATRRPTLIVTVDNGVSSVAGVEAAREMGVPVLVTDHHLPGAVLPRAQVIVNPNLPDSRFASPALAGVGVAFYVIAALARSLAA